MPIALTMDLIEEARRFLAGKVRRTAVEESPYLSDLLGVPVWLKLECTQTTGSFKVRGALFRLSKLTAGERRTGVATCSAGNHGKGTAYAARQMGVRATVYVPSSVNPAKLHGMEALGAEVQRSPFEGYDDTEAWAREQVARSGQLFISAFDDPLVMAGNGGTIAAEILEDATEARAFILPVGGGGHAAGFAFYAKKRLGDCQIIGCQHELSPALKLSLESGEAVTRLPAVTTLAAGVEGGIGRSTFEVLKTRTDRVALVSESEIRSAVVWLLKHHQILIEPTAAVTLAACLSGKVGALDGPAVVQLSGRNVDIATVRELLGS